MQPQTAQILFFNDLTLFLFLLGNASKFSQTTL